MITHNETSKVAYYSSVLLYLNSLSFPTKTQRYSAFIIEEKCNSNNEFYLNLV